MSGAMDRELSAIRAAAQDWVVQLSDEGVSAAERASFAAWLRRSPAHVTEYLLAEAAWQGMGGAAVLDHVAVHDLVDARRGAVVELPGGVRTKVVASRRMQAVKWGMAAAVLLAVGLAAVPRAVDYFDSGLYATGVGQTRRVMLPDGSQMELNTHSKVRVRMDAAAREVFIERGEAFFTVARDSLRPFRVHSNALVAQALGTRFNVYRQSGQTIVTVIEGRVAVTPPGGANAQSHPAELAAGDRVAVPAGREQTSALRVVAVDPRRAIAWRERRLIFENESLASVVAEFNRYNERQLVIGTAALATQRINGVFKADRPDALVDFLTKTGAVQAEEDFRSRTVLTLQR